MLLLVLRKNAWRWSASSRLETFVCKHAINILTIKFQWLCKERRFTKYTQISWKGRNFTFNAHVLKLPEPNRNNQYSNQKFLNSNNFPDSKISTSTRIRIHSRTQDENMLPIFLWEYGQQSMRRKALEICILTFHGKELGSILLRNRVKISGFSVYTIPES